MINRFREEYHFLSNLYSVPVLFDGITYKNSEAAFQAQKTLDLEERTQFANIINGVIAKRKGKKVKLRPDWEAVKDDIMYRVCLAKFSQNEDLKEKLLATGEEELVEGNNWRDTYWGVYNGVGQNRLGKILMRIREELREEQ